jgi:tape measure domain-containing protein
MSTSNDQINVKISADTSGLDTGMDQAAKAVQQGTDKMKAGVKGAGQEAERAKDAFSRSMGDIAGSLKNALAGFVALSTVKALAHLTDDATLASARITGITGSTQAATVAQRSLYEMSQRLQASVAEVSSSFARILPAVQELGGGVNEATKLSEILISTAKLSGASTAEASASALQFAQALASGTLQGDELRSILEGNNTLARELARSLGVTIGELRKMGSEGKLTSEVVANALLGSYDEIKAKTAELPPTVGGAWIQVENAFQKAVASMEGKAGFFKTLGLVLSEIAKVIETVAARFSVAGNESDKLGGNTGAKTFAQAVGVAFAYLVDIVDASIEQITMVGETIGAVAAAAVAVVQGDLNGAMAILREQGERDAAAVSRMADAYRGAGKAVQAYRAVLASGGDSSNEGRNAGPRALPNLKGKAKTEEKKTPEVMQGYEQQLQAQRLAQAQAEQEAGTYRSFSKQQEAEYWQHILDTEKVSAETRKAIQQKINAAKLADLEQSNSEMHALEDRDLEQRVNNDLKREQSEVEAQRILSDMQMRGALARIDEEQSAAQQRLELGQISQEEYLALQQQFEDRRLAIQRNALEQRLLEIDTSDPDSPEKKAQVYEQLLELQLQYEQRKRELTAETTRVQMDYARQVNDSLAGGLAPLLQKFMTWQLSIKNLFKGMAQAVMQSVTQMLAQIIAKKIAAFAVDKTLALAGITMDAAKAGAGAASSQASIPIVGPGLALAAMAAVFGAVSGMASNAQGASVPSASAGFDIPAGLSPLTQLHEREMVLPEEHADTIRSLGGGSGPREVVLKATPLRGNLFLMHRDDLQAALGELARDGAMLSLR